jgi:hypothetical protein
MKISYGNFIKALGFAVALSTAPAAQAVIMTDIIMIVDESGSMGNVQANLRNNIGSFASILSAGGIDAQYGLVGYGNSQVRPRMLTDLTNPTSFATAAQGLLINGGTEPGYTATAFALNALDNQSSLFSFRTNALKNIIIFTDEPHNGTALSYGTVGGVTVTLAIADSLLTNANALFNAVLRNTSTINSYKPLADAHSGNVYDLNGLNTTDQTVVSAFVDAFARSKLQEIVDFCTLNPTDPACQGGPGQIPEPGALALLGIGLMGLAVARRRKMV